MELILEDGYRQARIACPPGLIPAPGQYLLATDASDSPLPVPLFYTDFSPGGFIAAAPVPEWWTPGLEVHLQGPLGRGFTLPLPVHRVGLVAFDDSPARLKGLIRAALKQDAAVVLVGASTPEDIPDDVEVQPLSALRDIVAWADYLALDVARENLDVLFEKLGKQKHLAAGMGAQVLVRTPVPCGGVADCGICAVRRGSDWKMACKDGPVFDWREL